MDTKGYQELQRCANNLLNNTKYITTMKQAVNMIKLTKEEMNCSTKVASEYLIDKFKEKE